MTHIGSDTNPLRVAIVGAGPAGFYTAERLFKAKNIHITVDMYDRLPTPFGLVRNGVAPDHQKIKSVTKIFDRLANKPQFRFFGNVELGSDVTVADLRDHYHQIVYSTGAQTDRALNIPGIELENSHPATDFVAWYNGHPDFRDYEFDLTQESVAVIGIGNVAVDVARILCRTPEELAETDIADYAMEALNNSNVKDVIMMGRRGPAQAAFTPPEAKELGALLGADIVILEEEAELDPLTQESLADADRGTMRNIQIIQELSQRDLSGKPKRLTIRFLVSPTELSGNGDGKVASMKLVKNELYKTDTGTMRPRATETFENIPVGLVFRSIGYRGVPLDNVPFHDRWGVILNEKGRVLEGESNAPVLGEYTSGWIKRGPSGVIGTNKPDAAETADCMLADLAEGRHLSPAHPELDAVTQLVQQKQPNFVTYKDWLRLNELELAAGEEQGRPRVKFTEVDVMLAALGKKVAV
ncbi:MAG: FAD-dependent oxidoreductase [Chloroflexi bacterium]|nr:FAD-dependent oxidoreductase [Chloroflexota bacterium]